MKRKGFTLIELLAVIVILAVIALITTTIITKVVENSRKNAAKNSALNYLDTVEKYIMYHEVNDTKYPEEIESSSIYQISNKEYTLSDGKTAVENKNLNDILGNTIKGEKPDTGIVEFDEKRKVVSATMIVNNYNVTCTSSTSCTVEGKNTDPIPVLTINEDNIKVTETKITIPYTVEIEKGSATVECIYGTDTKYGQTGVINEENNTCTLSNLTSGTTYYYKLTPKSDKNKKGNSQISSKTTANYVHATEFKVGDYVYMVPTSKSYTPSTDSNDASYTGCPGSYSDIYASGSCENSGTINPSELRRWIIIKNDGSNIEMISESVSSTTITFLGTGGYENYVQALNKITQQYENNKFTSGSRYFGYYNQVLKCASYSDSNCEDLDGYIDDTNDTTGLVYNAIKKSRGDSISPLIAYLVDSKTYYPSENEGSYWIASRKHIYSPYNQQYYQIYDISSNGAIHGNGVYAYAPESGWNPRLSKHSIRPILTLKPNVVAEPSGDGSSEHPWVLVEQ